MQLKMGLKSGLESLAQLGSFIPHLVAERPTPTLSPSKFQGMTPHKETHPILGQLGSLANYTLFST